MEFPAICGAVKQCQRIRDEHLLSKRHILKAYEFQRLATILRLYPFTLLIQIILNLCYAHSFKRI